MRDIYRRSDGGSDMSNLSNVPLEKLIEKYYLILNSRIEVTPLEIRELQIELRTRNMGELSREKYLEIFIRCLDTDIITSYVKQAFSK